jgi:histidine decarboxylase
MDNAPLFDFRLPVGSISVSGHKTVGSPIPCGVVIALKNNVDKLKRHVELLNVHDTTTSGSRNGHTVLFLWYAIKKLGFHGLRTMVDQCVDVTEYTLRRLQELPWKAVVGEYSTTVIIKRPSHALVEKWQLAAEKDIAHILILPHITKKQVDELIEDLRQDMN